MSENIVFSTFRPEEETADILIIACHTIRKELEHAMAVTGREFPVIYLKSNLHHTPNLLNEALRDLINEASQKNIKRILLGYATCGNCVASLQTQNCEIIFPRTEDCITFFFGSMNQKRKMPAGTYYFTYGWLYGEGHGQNYYNEIMETHGPETGKEIIDMMLENYQYAGILDTHCYDSETFMKDAHAFAQKLELDPLNIDASNTYMEQLLTGPWDAERFFVFEPNHQIDETELTLP